MPYSIYHSIFITLFHSIWQMGLLYLVYKIFISPSTVSNPAQRKNILFFLLSFQLSLSAFTFFNLNSNSLNITQNYFSNILPHRLVSDVFYRNLFYAYCSLIAARAFFITWRYWQQKKGIVHNLIPVPFEIMETVNKLATQLLLPKKISCWCHAHITTPVVYGFLKPVIIFPVAALNTLSLQETEALLLHELAHIKYNDHLLNLLLIVQETLFFFNPFMWLIAKDIRHEREKACDILVINNGCERSIYASALYKVAVPFQSLQLSLAATGKKKKLLQRIQFFTQAEIHQKKRNTTPQFVFSFLSLVLVCLCSVIVSKNQDNKLLYMAAQVPAILTPVATNTVVRNEAMPIIKSEMLVVNNIPAKRKSPPKISTTSNKIGPVLANVELPVIKFSPQIKMPVYNVSYVEDANKNTRIIYLEEENSDGQKTVTMITVQREGENINVTPVLKVESFTAASDSLRSIKFSDTGKVFIYH